MPQLPVTLELGGCVPALAPPSSPGGSWDGAGLCPRRPPVPGAAARGPPRATHPREGRAHSMLTLRTPGRPTGWGAVGQAGSRGRSPRCPQAAVPDCKEPLGAAAPAASPLLSTLAPPPAPPPLSYGPALPSSLRQARVRPILVHRPKIPVFPGPSFFFPSHSLWIGTGSRGLPRGPHTLNSQISCFTPNSLLRTRS